jgi:hypothetical protein
MNPLESNAMYYYTEIHPSTRLPIRGTDSLIQGVSIEPYTTPIGGAQGAIHWFDKIAGYQRTIEVETIPSLREKSFTIIGTKGIGCFFQYIDLDVYNRLVRQLLPAAPPFTSEIEIQKYLKTLNPYV